VLSTAETVMLLTAVCVVVADANTAVAVSNGTSTKNHAVPSLAIEQSRADVGAGNGKNRFVATTVFGVVVWYLNVTVFEALIDHAPVNVAMRKTFRCAGGTASNVSGRSDRSPVSTLRIVFAMRRTADSSRMTGRTMRHAGGVAKNELKFTSRCTRRSKIAGAPSVRPPLPLSPTGPGEATHSAFSGSNTTARRF
jgi:hypothetical protein